ncbi:adenine nucleotide alpha hydrolases-like protein [Phialemonium atrogriseum]|uniref:Diphthine--ammonia ligase n=1 Tax=Phialemonium atrogriseum TaxID=1093897 RepID=A0AAJ0C3B6_9PEZI|nr:adenine nucleotide alpha hydrolases-like protein [Phialemonium atrogriseum]KAK1768318.1 adenine nucleotide alpha hydrolases-like protein [Phialemonium atrogriseum]
MAPPNPPPGGPPPKGLNVIALVSGGKDSFFSLLHCRANGHRVVALANLYPQTTPSGNSPDALSTAVLPGSQPSGPSTPHALSQGWEEEQQEEEADLNSFMYQTVGHQVIPLYADATSIPLYRHPITGSAAQSGKDYSHAGVHPSANPRGGGWEAASHEDRPGDETEAMLPLLRAVMAAHPEANALAAGAILSTYQRTRVESVASRLGLVPLAYLWKYPSLPLPPSSASDDGAAEDEEDGSQLLADMAGAGLEARVVKVASGGLDESFLWEDVAGPEGRARVRRAMRRFGSEGAVLGEGGEFETLVVDGPGDLFRRRIVIPEAGRRVVREGGGSAWLSIRGARVEEKVPGGPGGSGSAGGRVRIPGLLDARFVALLEGLTAGGGYGGGDDVSGSGVQGGDDLPLGLLQHTSQLKMRQWCVVGDLDCRSSIEAETSSLVEAVRTQLGKSSLPPTSIINTVIILRHVSDFPTVNKIYGSLFFEPNPPSRVTISSGDLLPATCNIALYLSVHHDLAPGDRQGLHVQSRSYWAPANIGPYSQAIVSPLTPAYRGGEESDAPPPRLVHVAGQIPLVPATMDLPRGALDLQLALSLQHLWRVGAEMGVQWWASAVAYLPRAAASPGAVSTRERAALAAQAWTAAHRWSGADADAEDEWGGPDLWDRKYNPLYMSFAGAEKPEPHRLPDWSVLEAEDPEARPVPFFFAAEVHELPRQAEVEWHAHLGLARLAAESVHLVSASASGPDPPARLQAQHAVVKLRGGAKFFVHSVIALRHPPVPAEEKTTVPALLGELGGLLPRWPASPTGADASVSPPPAPTLLYTDVGAVALSADDLGSCPVVPCASLWDGQGERLLAVAVYQTNFEKAS